MPKVLITDYAWPDISEEQRILEAAGHTVVAGPSTAGSEAEIDALVQAHQPAAIMTCWAEVSSKAVQSSPDLRVVARLGVGLDNIAVQTCTERGIWVTNVPDYCMEEVSDQAMAFLLDWTRGVSFFDSEVKAGRWDPAGAKLRRLANLTIGIVGFGRIARYTVRKSPQMASSRFRWTRCWPPPTRWSFTRPCCRRPTTCSTPRRSAR
jgi:D-3-phosphoglycerate dehydrogenase / 2-oxoglutarate reductase